MLDNLNIRNFVTVIVLFKETEKQRNGERKRKIVTLILGNKVLRRMRDKRISKLSQTAKSRWKTIFNYFWREAPGFSPSSILIRIPRRHKILRLSTHWNSTRPSAIGRYTWRGWQPLSWRSNRPPRRTRRMFHKNDRMKIQSSWSSAFQVRRSWKVKGQWFFQRVEKGRWKKRYILLILHDHPLRVYINSLNILNIYRSFMCNNFQDIIFQPLFPSFKS